MTARQLVYLLLVASCVTFASADFLMNESAFVPARSPSSTNYLSISMSSSPTAPTVGNTITFTFTMTVSTNGGVTNTSILGSDIINDGDRKLQIFTYSNDFNIVQNVYASDFTTSSNLAAGTFQYTFTPPVSGTYTSKFVFSLSAPMVSTTTAMTGSKTFSVGGFPTMMSPVTTPFATTTSYNGISYPPANSLRPSQPAGRGFLNRPVQLNTLSVSGVSTVGYSYALNFYSGTTLLRSFPATNNVSVATPYIDNNVGCMNMQLTVSDYATGGGVTSLTTYTGAQMRSFVIGTDNSYFAAYMGNILVSDATSVATDCSSQGLNQNASQSTTSTFGPMTSTYLTLPSQGTFVVYTYNENNQTQLLISQHFVSVGSTGSQQLLLDVLMVAIPLVICGILLIYNSTGMWVVAADPDERDG